MLLYNNFFSLKYCVTRTLFTFILAAVSTVFEDICG